MIKLIRLFDKNVHSIAHKVYTALIGLFKKVEINRPKEETPRFLFSLGGGKGETDPVCARYFIGIFW